MLVTVDRSMLYQLYKEDLSIVAVWLEAGRNELNVANLAPMSVQVGLSPATPPKGHPCRLDEHRSGGDGAAAPSSHPRCTPRAFSL